MPTLTTGTTTQMWQALIRDAGQRIHTRLDEATESYLVFTLLRHSRDGWLTSRTLALELLDGFDQMATLRQERLRDVGDRCLLIAGLFHGQARRRRVSEDYYVDLGRCAYGELAIDGRNTLASLYHSLVAQFARLVGVLRHVRPASSLPIPTVRVSLPATATVFGNGTRH